jgi:Fur family ferric uptake transcriptional regulator/Fur family peroxide stress response transcriptional regulator
MPTLSKTTVYNTLNLLEKQGVIRAIRIDEKNVRYDADISEHAHFKCKLCGEIHDLKVKGIGNLEPDNSKNFLITEYQMYYSGFCDKCAEYKTISVN